MRPSVFVDTAGWLALLNAKDQLHARALLVNSRLRTQNTCLVTAEFVLIEVADAFAAPPLRSLAVTFIDGVRQSSAAFAVEIAPVSPELLARGWFLYKQRPDKGWGLTDCTSFVVMQEEGIYDAFTSDHHFIQAGFHCLL